MAAGPSLTLNQVRQIGIARAQDAIRVIAINDSIYPCWYADVAYACDRKWWEKHQGVPHFGGLKLSLEETRFSDVRHLRNTGIEGYDPTPGCIRSGSNGGYQAAHVAADVWARKIILVAYDYSDNGARDHWFGKHEPGMDKHSNVQNWRHHLRGLTDILQTRGIKVLNASITSTIDWLPRIGLESEGWWAR